MSATSSSFDRLRWDDERLLVGDLVFQLGERDGTALPPPKGQHEPLVLYKSKGQLDQFLPYLALLDFHPKNVLELGIWEGGSTVLWYELFRPRKHVAIDLSERGDTEPFRRWRSSRGLEARVKTHWGVDQGVPERLRSIVAEEFDGPLDLVIDDASHLYNETKASFETLFPLLRPRGLYFIEDWQWGHNPDFADPSHPWADSDSLTQLVFELVEAAGTARVGAVKSVTVYGSFVVAERGRIPTRPEDFSLEACIMRRPHDRPTR